MSKVSDLPELGENKEVLYSINIYEDEGKLKIELDKEGNIKTNINRLIVNIINYKKEGKIIKVEHDLYHRLNSGINPISGTIKEEIVEIIENLYYSEKKVA